MVTAFPDTGAATAPEEPPPVGMVIVMPGIVVVPVAGPEAVAPGAPASDCPAPGWIPLETVVPAAPGCAEPPHALAANKVATASAATPALRG